VSLRDRTSEHEPRRSGLVWKNLEVPFSFYLEVKEIRLPDENAKYKTPLLFGTAFVKPSQAVEGCPLPVDEESDTSFFIPQSFATQLKKIFGEDWVTSSIEAVLYVDYQGLKRFKGTSFYSFFIEDCEDQRKIVESTELEV